MPFDAGLAERIRDRLDGHPGVTEKRMFGGLAFLVGGKMALGIVRDELMVRVGAEAYAAALREAHVRPMDFTKRPMKGFVFVAPPGFAEDEDLARWVERAVHHAEGLSRGPCPRGSALSAAARASARSTPPRR